MMKTMKMVWLPLLLVGALSVSWYFTAPPYFTTTASNGHHLMIEPPPMDDQDKLQTGTRTRLLFINSGDGRYHLINQFSANTIDVPHPYRLEGNYSAYAEATEVYTDKKPPESVMRLGPDPNQGAYPSGTNANIPVSNIPSITVSTGMSSLDPWRKTMATSIQIEPTRRLALESGVTYAVTVENKYGDCGTMNGNIIFTYDDDILDYIETKNYYTGTTVGGPFPATASNGPAKKNKYCFQLDSAFGTTHVFPAVQIKTKSHDKHTC